MIKKETLVRFLRSKKREIIAGLVFLGVTLFLVWSAAQRTDEP